MISSTIDNPGFDASSKGSGLSVGNLCISVPERCLLKDCAFSVADAEMVAIMGPSGSGKTSLLNCLAGIRSPDQGSMILRGTDIAKLSRRHRSALRLNAIGMVFQHSELIPELSGLENVALPLRLKGTRSREALTTAREWLAQVGVEYCADRLPHQLSGGEAQRIAIARAMAGQPSLVLADEPTGALDEENSHTVASLLRQHSRTVRAAVVIATHDPLVAAYADRVLRLQGGILEPVEQA